MTVADVVEQNLEQFRNCFVKVIINNKTQPYWFDMFMEKLEKVEPIHVQVVEDHLNLDLEDADELIEEAQDTLTILNNYVNQLEQITDKPSVSKMVHELYQEALRVD
jgi:predicted RNA methylase